MEPSLQDGDSALTAAVESLPDWFLFAVPLLGLGMLFAVGIGAFGIWMVLNQLRRLETLAQRLDLLEGLQVSLKSLVAGRSDLDLRRIEHALLEIRAGQKRLHETLLRFAEATAEVELAPAPSKTPGIAERIVNRLIALGYERVQILTTSDELGAMVEGEGEVVVEARRYGALCKGRILLRDGVIVEVKLQPAYSLFP